MTLHDPELSRLEVLGRMRGIVIFNALKREETERIVEIQLEGPRRRLAERKIHLRLSSPAREWRASVGPPVVRFTNRFWNENIRAIPFLGGRAMLPKSPV